MSDEVLMQFGVPLLFLIYINEFHVTVKYSSSRLFADDSNLLIIKEWP